MLSKGKRKKERKRISRPSRFLHINGGPSFMSSFMEFQSKPVYIYLENCAHREITLSTFPNSQSYSNIHLRFIYCQREQSLTPFP